MTTSRLSKKDKSRRKVLGHIVMPHNKSLSLRRVSVTKLITATFAPDTWRKLAEPLGGAIALVTCNGIGYTILCGPGLQT